MTSQRLSLTLILVAVAVAGIIVGYALAGLDDGTPLHAQVPDTMPILNAIATSVAPAEPTPSPTPNPLDTLPPCADPQVQPGDLCVPVMLTPPPCGLNEMYPSRAVVPLPCRKSPE